MKDKLHFEEWFRINFGEDRNPDVSLAELQKQLYKLRGTVLCLERECQEKLMREIKKSACKAAWEQTVDSLTKDPLRWTIQ